MKIRLTIFLAILAGLFTYTAEKILLSFPVHPIFIWILTLLFFLMMFGPQFWAHADDSRVNSSLFRFYSRMGSILMGAWATFVFIWLVIDACRGILFLIRWVAPDWLPPFSNSPIVWISCGISIFSLIVAIIGFWQAKKGPRIKDVPIVFPDLPSDLDGLKIVLISDLHIGPTIRRENVQKVVEQVLSLHPDLIAVTGDLVDGSADALTSEIEPLAKLKAPLGTYYVTGNHEYYWGAKEWVEKVKTVGFDPLINENRVIHVGKSKVLVSGIPDLSAEGFVEEHKPDLNKAIFSHEKTDFKILLSHRPNVSDQAEALGFDLQLSGHTHGGQFFPFTLIVPFFMRYHRGLYRHNRLSIYVSVGTGHWGPPNRFGNPSEITLLRLTKNKIT